MGRRNAASQQSAPFGKLPALAAALSLGLGLGLCLSGCASISQQIAETASQAPEIGLSPNAPARPAQQMAYPAVHDVPPPRTAAVLTDIEQQKLETDLVSARNQQQAMAGVTPADRKKTQSSKAQVSKDQAAKDRAAKDQARKVQGARDLSSAPAPISTASSRTIY